MPRKAAVLSGAIAATRGSSHAYVVFAEAAAASKALAHNMREVGSPAGSSALAVGSSFAEPMLCLIQCCSHAMKVK